MKICASLWGTALVVSACVCCIGCMVEPQTLGEESLFPFENAGTDNFPPPGAGRSLLEHATAKATPPRNAATPGPFPYLLSLRKEQEQCPGETLRCPMDGYRQLSRLPNLVSAASPDPHKKAGIQGVFQLLQSMRAEQKRCPEKRLRCSPPDSMLSPAEIKKKWCPKKGRRRKKKGQAKSSELGEDSSARSGLTNGVYLPRAFAVAPTDAFTGNDGKRYKNPQAALASQKKECKQLSNKWGRNCAVWVGRNQALCRSSNYASNCALACCQVTVPTAHRVRHCRTHRKLFVYRRHPITGCLGTHCLFIDGQKSYCTPIDPFASGNGWAPTGRGLSLHEKSGRCKCDTNKVYISGKWGNKKSFLEKECKQSSNKWGRNCAAWVGRNPALCRYSNYAGNCALACCQVKVRKVSEHCVTKKDFANVKSKAESKGTYRAPKVSLVQKKAVVDAFCAACSNRKYYLDPQVRIRNRVLGLCRQIRDATISGKTFTSASKGTTPWVASVCQHQDGVVGSLRQTNFDPFTTGSGGWKYRYGYTPGDTNSPYWKGVPSAHAFQCLSRQASLSETSQQAASGNATVFRITLSTAAIFSACHTNRETSLQQVCTKRRDQTKCDSNEITLSGNHTNQLRLRAIDIAQNKRKCMLHDGCKNHTRQKGSSAQCAQMLLTQGVGKLINSQLPLLQTDQMQSTLLSECKRRRKYLQPRGWSSLNRIQGHCLNENANPAFKAAKRLETPGGKCMIYSGSSLARHKICQAKPASATICGVRVPIKNVERVQGVCNWNAKVKPAPGAKPGWQWRCWRRLVITEASAARFVSCHNKRSGNQRCTSRMVVDRCLTKTVVLSWSKTTPPSNRAYIDIENAVLAQESKWDNAKPGVQCQNSADFKPPPCDSKNKCKLLAFGDLTLPQLGGRSNPQRSLCLSVTQSDTCTRQQWSVATSLL